MKRIYYKTELLYLSTSSLDDTYSTVDSLIKAYNERKTDWFAFIDSSMLFRSGLPFPHQLGFEIVLIQTVESKYGGGKRSQYSFNFYIEFEDNVADLAMLWKLSKP